MEKIGVIGSINMDLTVRLGRFPQPGETLPGRDFTTSPGGKGGNQAVALGKLGARVMLAGHIGRDVYGQQYRRALLAAGVDISAVGEVDLPNGVALIQVDDRGENTIVVASGANDAGDAAWMERTFPLLRDCRIFLMQLEIPMESVLLAARKIRAMGAMLILDPAPMQPVPQELLELADILTPNEHELRSLTPRLMESAPPEARILHLLQSGVRCVLHKSGAKGAYLGKDGRVWRFPAFRVEAVDTTAAGDTFNAALATGIERGYPLEACVRLANAAAALSVTKFGAQAGMPSFGEAEAFMQEGLET